MLGRVEEGMVVVVVVPSFHHLSIVKLKIESSTHVVTHAPVFIL